MLPCCYRALVCAHASGSAQQRVGLYAGAYIGENLCKLALLEALGMFTTIAFIALAAIGLLVGRTNEKDRNRSVTGSDDEVRQSILHARQDLKLIAFLLGAILVMLGVLADVVIAH